MSSQNVLSVLLHTNISFAEMILHVAGFFRSMYMCFTHQNLSCGTFVQHGKTNNLLTEKCFKNNQLLSLIVYAGF